MAFMIHPPPAAPFRSASRMTPRPSLPIPSPHGGNAKESVVMAVRPNFWFWQTPAAVTVAPPGPGRRKSRHKYAIGSALPPPLLIILPVPPTGIPSSTACSPRSPKTGLPSPLTATRRCSIHSHYQHSDRLGCDRVSGPERVSNRSQTRPAFDLFAASHPRQTTAAMELHDPTQSVKLFLRPHLAPILVAETSWRRLPALHCCHRS